jgi:hypothetical protein
MRNMGTFLCIRLRIGRLKIRFVLAW